MLKERKIHSSHTESTAGSVKRLSLRDPAGSLFELNGRLYRFISTEVWPTYERIYSSFIVKKLIQEGKLIDFRILPDNEAADVLLQLKKTYPDQNFYAGKILEHKKIAFVAYPHEWCSEMLRQAALLTVEMAERLLEYGLGLKDATPFNILYENNKPVFVDVLSIEERDLNSPTWMAFGQFCKTFVNTLLLSNQFGISFEKSLASNRDGLPSETVYSLLSLRQKLSPTFFTRVTVPVLLAKFHNPNKTGIYKKQSTSTELAKFTLQYLFSSLRKTLNKLDKTSAKNTANLYMEQQLPYSKDQFGEKETAVQNMLRLTKAKNVFDAGCNTGHFSLMAAKNGARVVAADTDKHAVSALFKTAQESNLSILPLQMDITSPTPATGWENEETSSFMNRATGSFDAVLMLALIHHLQTTHSIPLVAIASLASKLTNEWLIIENISPQDPVFVGLARGRDYSYVTDVYFEKIFGTLFTVEQKIVQKESLRTLYLMKKISVDA